MSPPITKPRFCQFCDRQIPPSVIIDGVRRQLHARSYCLVCSPFGAGNSRHLKAYKPTKVCRRCTNELPREKFAKRERRCKACAAADTRSARQNFKRACVGYLGGSCQRCGYSRCLGALEFHHRDPGEKDFEISRRRREARLNAEVMAELDKCDLLCRNCHAEAHDEATQHGDPRAVAGLKVVA